MKPDFHGRLFAVVALIVFGFGIYWAVAVYPKRGKFWTAVESVTEVSSARIEIDGESVRLEKTDAARIFGLIRSSPDYSPDHPATIRRGAIAFDTDEGTIAFTLVDTSNQGVLLGASENGWNYGDRRCDDLGALLPPRADEPAGSVPGE